MGAGGAEQQMWLIAVDTTPSAVPIGWEGLGVFGQLISKSVRAPFFPWILPGKDTFSYKSVSLRIFGKEKIVPLSFVNILCGGSQGYSAVIAATSLEL